MSRYITCQNVTSGSFDQSADILDIFHIHNAWSHCGAEFMVYTRFFYYLDGTLDFIRQCRILHRGEHRIFLRHCLYIHSYKVRLKAQDPVRECAVCIYLEQVAHILDCLGQLAQILVYKGLATGYADTLQKATPFLKVSKNLLVIKRLRVERMIRKAASEQDSVPEDLIADKRFYDDEIEKLKGMRS